MKKSGLFLLLSMLALACDETEKEIVPSNTSVQENKDEVVESPPLLVEGFPVAIPGATSVDLELKTDKASTVHYVVTEKPMDFSPVTLVEEASEPSLPEIKFSGSVTVSASESVIQSIPSLKEGKAYYTYIATADADTVASEIEKIEFKTHIRQDTSQFNSSFEKRVVDYLLYRPEEVFKNPDKKYPLMIFLGGRGEHATKSKRINLIQNGLLPEYIHKGNDVPMIVMSVQHVTKSWENELINEALDHAMATLPVDKNKVYMVGTSAGAFGVWQFAQEYPERLTAIVPISGGGRKDKACNLNQLAVWAFHNKTDYFVPSNESKRMIQAINECNPGKAVRLQIFDDTGHNCWRRIFDPQHPDWKLSPDAPKVALYDWLLDQSRATAN